MSVIADAKTTDIIVSGLFISPKVEDNNNAVTIYLAISISHLPNSYLIEICFILPPNRTSQDVFL